MLGSTVLGGVMKMWAQGQQDKHDAHIRLLDFNKSVQESVDSARAMQGPRVSWIRRFIVVVAMLAGVGVVFFAPMLDQVTNVPLQVTTGRSWLFGLIDTTRTVTEYVKLEGWVTPEWLPVTIMNIIGFYFGSAAMARR
jgi:uncharacterized membrane protein YfcA